MFAGLVENLGLKEGLQEFRDQFNKDAKATIAETQFAQDRGIDVAKLDAWEQNIHEQGADIHERTIAKAVEKGAEIGAEIHERTIARAVETLAQDETIAQLLELKPTKQEGDDDGEEEDVEEDSAGDDRGEDEQLPQEQSV